MKFNDLVKNGILFDSHCHLNMPEYDLDRNVVLDQMVKDGVETVVDIGTDGESSRRAVYYSKESKGRSFAAVGVDMEACVPGSELYKESFEDVLSDFEACEKLDFSPEIMMIGETGIDLYWNRKNEVSKEVFNESFEKQRILFQKHIELANKYKLPLSIHSRDAVDECLSVVLTTPNPFLEQERATRGVFHSLTPEFDDDEKSFYNKINQIHEAGFFIGLNGIVTYKSAKMMRNIILKVLKEKVGDKSSIEVKDIYDAGFVFETDGPFLSPEGKRGERNEPGNVKVIYEFIKDQLNNFNAS